MQQATTITDDIFSAFLNCKYKAYLKLAGQAGEPSEYERLQDRLTQRYRAEAQRRFLDGFGEVATILNPLSPAEAIHCGQDALIDATLGHNGESAHLDAARLLPGKGNPVEYEPILFVRSERVSRDDKLRLAFAASVLGRVQGTLPAVGRVVHGRGFVTTRVQLGPLAEPLKEAVAQIKGIAAAGKPPTLILNRHCAECEFRSRCHAAAVEKDDLSLLGGLKAKEITTLNRKGIFTVTQYSHTFRRRKKTKKRHDTALQALAVREGKVYVAQRPDLPSPPTLVYLDVEGLPDTGFHYLVGLVVVQGESRTSMQFWADDEAGEALIWHDFLQAAGSWTDFALFHYGDYEARFLKRMAERHGGDAGLIRGIAEKAVNVLSLIYSWVYFPAYSNDLKSVASCLGFRWSVPGASGMQSVVWRQGWEEGRDDALKKRLLRYNEEDCIALERVVCSLRAIAADEAAGHGVGRQVARVEDLPRSGRHKYGKVQAALPGLDRIIECSYFDYQREKVLFRTNPAVRKCLARRKRAEKPSLRANREVECGIPSACTGCGSTSLAPFSRYSKTVIDLKLFKGGVKRWITRYRVKRYRCDECGAFLVPEDYRAVASNKYGWALCSWVAHKSVALRQTNDHITDDLGDIFGLPLASSTISKLRRRAAEFYLPTYDSLLATLRKGHLAHADETRVRMKPTGMDAYVWVFATPDTAVYVYSPTREGDTPRSVLEGFRGVLVSDFYAAYDGLDCRQQKCLIHLARDLNDDILKNPFDEELKQLASAFTILLQGIVATIDRHGLNRFHLQGHKKDVERFYTQTVRRSYESELARHYQERMEKNEGKLFTFLNHDGVPWNNNNCENAVKAFVSRRKVRGIPFTENGIKDYLVLLSIYKTLRYRGLSFLKFMLSGQTDIEAFTAGRR
jgi:predicted RecB family nuclease